MTRPKLEMRKFDLMKKVYFSAQKFNHSPPCQLQNVTFISGACMGANFIEMR